jgi:hypothetical protein
MVGAGGGRRIVGSGGGGGIVGAGGRSSGSETISNEFSFIILLNYIYSKYYNFYLFYSLKKQRC